MRRQTRRLTGQSQMKALRQVAREGDRQGPGHGLGEGHAERLRYDLGEVVLKALFERLQEAQYA